MQRKPMQSWIHVPILVLVASLCLFWHWHTPVPNKSVLVIAGVAIVMALFEPHKFFKVIYLAFVVWLMVIESHAIDLDRTQTILEDAQRRTEQNAQFSSILNGILTEISTDEDHFAETMRKSNELADSSKRNLDLTQHSLNQITGGDQFCYLIPITQVGQNQWRIAVINSGRYPLAFCHVIVHKHFNADEGLRLMATPEGRATVMAATEKWFGPLPAGKQGFASDLVLETATNYDIQIYTWNGQFAETLFINQDWVKRHVPLNFVQVNGGPGWKVLYHDP